MTGTEIRSKKSERNVPVNKEEDNRSFKSDNRGIYAYIFIERLTNFFFNLSDLNSSMDNVVFNEESNGKNVNLTPNSQSLAPSSRIYIDYPGKKDRNVIQDVEKCLAFYHKIREHFDDDVAAMLLKCCLCYGGCSGQR